MKNNQTNDWNGYTLEELKLKRAKALVLSEVSKAQLLASYQVAKGKTNSHGLRAWLFGGDVLRGLKVTDYLMLSAKAAVFGYRLWRKVKR